MVSIKWCLKQKNGLEVVEPNNIMADSYLKMAEESLNVLPNMIISKIWTVTAAYYIFYYSLYAVMLRLGIKCEIHTCSLEFMKQYLESCYDKKDNEMINKAFSARIDLQYYADRVVDSKIIDEGKVYCKKFFIKINDVLAAMTEDKISEIRERVKKELEQ